MWQFRMICRQARSNFLCSGMLTLIMGSREPMRFKDRIENVGLIVSFSNMMDDTPSMADLILPQNNPLKGLGHRCTKAGPGLSDDWISTTWGSAVF
ncbi:MAG: hypothetical protein CM1200mP3_02600 [Chloroflexota bacterium]|nr:MAG: hypothetical protein CM1200mP3_02600 [Chloroflexota bacterium]